MAAGDLATFDLLMDFSDDAKGAPGGGFASVFDSSVLACIRFFRDSTIGDPLFNRNPDIFNGLLESWGVAAFSALPPVAIPGGVVFQVLPTPGAGTTSVATQDTMGAAGPRVDGTPFVDLIPVDYNQVAVTGVPVPVAAWLLVSGLGMRVLLGVRRWLKQPIWQTIWRMI